MLARSIRAVALTALLPACDGDRVLREPMTVRRHGVTVTASNAEKGKLRIVLHNERDERISKPARNLWLHLSDGIATITLGPSELYFTGYPHLQYKREADGIAPGSSWEMVGSLPDELEPAPETKSARVGRGKSRQRHQEEPTRFDKARLRVWIFPHVGIAQELVGHRYEVLPIMNIDPAPNESSLRGDSETYRSFSPTAERDVFRSRRYDPTAETSLYFVETDIDLARPLEIHWFTDDE